MEIYPSLISSDVLNLQKTVELLNPHCNGYHLDIMDGHFVENLTWGPLFVNAIRKITHLPLHIHLMVEKPASWIKTFSLHKNDTIIFHAESIKTQTDQENLIAILHSKGLSAGIAINPQTPIFQLLPLINSLDTILLMSVIPGFSGQTFIPDVLKKVHPLLAMKKQSNRIIKIGMDGGINAENIKFIAHDIDFIGVAAGIFHQPDPISALKDLYKIAKT